MPISIELAEQVLGEEKIIESNNTLSIGEKPAESLSIGAMEGKLRITNQHVMFLCEKPMVDTRGTGHKAARIAAGIVTIGWSQVVTGQIDKRKRKKFGTKIEHPYSFAIPHSSISSYDGKKGKSWSRQQNHYLKFFVENDEESPLIIWIFKDINKYIDAFEKVKDSFGHVEEPSFSNDVGDDLNHDSEVLEDVDPLELLKKRLAHGEITKEEYFEIKGVLDY